MKNNINILILLVFTFIGCSQNNEYPRISTNANNIIEFEGLKYNTMKEFNIKFDDWVTKQQKTEKSPIVEFKPNPETNMEMVNELKDIIKGYHNILRVSIQSKNGYQKLVKYPPRIDKNNIPDLSFLKPRNILNFKITENGIFKDSINDNSIPIKNINSLVLEYILSDGTNLNLPEKTIYKIPGIGTYNAAKKLIITLKCSSKVKFTNYQKMKWEILSGYEHARTMKSKEIYNRDYSELNKSERKILNEIIPIVLSELPWE